MMSPRLSLSGRRGLSLMEVLVALTVFLLALVVLGRLIIFGSDRALDAQYQVLAADLCQTKMAEVLAGVLPLSPHSDVSLEEDPHWRWSLDCARSNYPGLWNVTIHVSRQQAQGTRVFGSLTQMVLEPQIHGSVQDVAPDNGARSDVPSTGSSSSPTGSPSSASGPSPASKSSKGANSSSKGGS